MEEVAEEEEEEEEGLHGGIASQVIKLEVGPSKKMVGLFLPYPIPGGGRGGAYPVLLVKL
jgi:hypothetical protein